jgi:hypothetical protein
VTCWLCSSSCGTASTAWHPTSWHHVPKTCRPCCLRCRTRPCRTWPPLCGRRSSVRRRSKIRPLLPVSNAGEHPIAIPFTSSFRSLPRLNPRSPEPLVI